jgi:SAM-dependent methyltransferase
MTDSVFAGLSALADPLRGRILLALERHELTVTELCAVFQLPQSSMSRQLRVLADEKWVGFRAEGPTRRYSMPREGLAPVKRQVWQAVRGEIAALPGVPGDEERLAVILSERRARSRTFFTSAAGEWDRLRRELVGRRLDVLALLALLDERWVVGDLGCGTGSVTETVAPFVGRVIAVDESAAMLETARERLASFPGVEVREGELERLPLESGTLDAAIIFLALQYVVEPSLVVREAARVARPGGRVVIVDLGPHDREEYRQRFGHQSLGFPESEVTAWMESAGLEGIRLQILPPDAEAKGPRLFVASGRRFVGRDPANEGGGEWSGGPRRPRPPQ